MWLWFDRQEAGCVCRDCERVAEDVPRDREGRAVPPTREEELDKSVRKLEAQVAYLKKSIVLKAQRRPQTGTKP